MTSKQREKTNLHKRLQWRWSGYFKLENIYSLQLSRMSSVLSTALVRRRNRMADNFRTMSKSWEWRCIAWLSDIFSMHHNCWMYGAIRSHYYPIVHCIGYTSLSLNGAIFVQPIYFRCILKFFRRSANQFKPVQLSAFFRSIMTTQMLPSFFCNAFLISSCRMYCTLTRCTVCFTNNKVTFCLN